MKSIGSCLWFDDQGEEAAKFYTSLFPGSKIGPTLHYGPNASEMAERPLGSAMAVWFDLPGQGVLGLNGGPHFKINPSLSLFVTCESEAEIDRLWKKLSEGGKPMMGLDRYPWADKYGWIADKYGATWQLILSKEGPGAKQKVAPAFLFVNELFGKGAEAIDFYTKIFPNSGIGAMTKDPSDGHVVHCMFRLNGQEFRLMDGPGKHAFSFNEGYSLVVGCETQEEIDRLWSKLLEGGGEESQCGWLKDKYGVSWQICPAQIHEWARDDKRYDALMGAMSGMRKLDLAKLKKAYESA